MEVKVFDGVDAAAKGAAAVIASEARAAVAARGRFVMAVSGGHTPWQMLRAMAAEDVPWKAVHVAQVDERVAPVNDPDRNLAHLRESLLAHAPLSPGQIHAMPVESPDLAAALDIADLDVAVTGGTYQGRRRMTLTYPMLNRSRRIVWLVTGSEKVDMLARLRAGDRSIPAGRVDQARALVLADRDAAPR